MATVTLKNLSHASSDRDGVLTSVKDVNLEIGDGEFAVFVGPARSGKSTVLRLIVGLEKISAGEVMIGERRVNDLAPKDRDVAMVFRDYALYLHMSVHENMAVGLRLRKFPQAEIKKRVQDAAAILEIESLLERKPKALATEEQLRVAIGRALVRQPKVILFEDALAKLDMATRAQMRIELTKLHQRLQATMIFTTEDSMEAMGMADRMLVLRDGVVQQIDVPSAVYHASANLFVAGFVGRPPMNFIHGALKQERDAFLFREPQAGTIELRLPASGREELAASAGQPIVLGIRPEDIEITQSEGSAKAPTNTFPALLEIVESVGGSANLSLQTGAHTLICRTQSAIDRSEAGRRIRFTIDPAKAHFFDPVSTRRIA